MGRERRKDRQEKPSGNPEPTAQRRIAAELGKETLPWLNGKRVQVNLEPVTGASTTVYVGSIADAYSGNGGIPPADSSAFEAFKRVAQTVSNTPGFRSDDCLTQNTGDKRIARGPAVKVHLVGRNAKGSASFIYYADTHIQEVRSLLYLGASFGDRRRQFENPLTGLRYSSAGNVANSGRRMH